jgi:peroxiredoxin
MKWRSLEESTSENASRSLRDVYAERKRLIEQYVPADVRAIHARAVSELKQAEIAKCALQVGDEAPAFELPDHNGKTVSSGELLQRGLLIVLFFRGRWCPFCVGQLEAMNAIFSQIQQIPATLVAISPQTVHQSYLMVEQHHLRFPVLSDAENRVARQFGLTYRVPDYQQEIYRRVFVNLPFVNGDTSWELPIPATFITGSKPRLRNTDQAASSRAVLYSSANQDYTERPEPSDILARLSQLAS